jgi:hypothetical protein
VAVEVFMIEGRRRRDGGGVMISFGLWDWGSVVSLSFVCVA